MKSLLNPTKLLLPLLLLSAASGCGGRVSLSPPLADLKAVTEPKPTPTVDIVTSQVAADLYSADVEAWGDRLFDAGGRLCRWNERVYKLKLSCPEPPPSQM